MNHDTLKYDVVIIGAGIVGMAIARELLQRNVHLSIAILEKEHDVAQHASGRNSGVLHAGFYYGESSLKAKFCVQGNRMMKAFCREHGIAINENQKIVVAQNQKELDTLMMLYQRGQNNGVELTVIDAEDVAKIDPHIRTFQKALLSPTTATVNPKQVSQALKVLLESHGVTFMFNTQFERLVDRNTLHVSGGVALQCQTLVNAAGMYALDLAHDMGLKTPYVTLPFKGAYLKGKDTSDLPNINIYPVPDIQYPFLGVHVTSTVDHEIKLGPTAMPAFWYEQYQGMSRFKLGEFLRVLYYFSKMMLLNIAGTRKLAIRELSHYRKRKMVSESKKLLRSIRHRFDRYPAGIRAQLFDKQKKQWEMDFVVEKQGSICHVLNAVSPGFTCSFAFAQYVVDQLGVCNSTNKEEVCNV